MATSGFDPLGICSQTFKLEITLGNAGMDDYEDIASALYSVGDRLLDRTLSVGSILDTNGNNVGSWEIS